MDQKPLNLAIVGCGNIAESYGKSLRPYPQLNLYTVIKFIREPLWTDLRETFFNAGQSIKVLFYKLILHNRES
jgi:hypothetical protein